MGSRRTGAVVVALGLSLASSGCSMLSAPPPPPATVTVVAQPVSPTPTPTATPTPSAAEMDDAELARTFGPAVFLVESEGCGAAWTGTAWAVDENHLVTNHHVVANDATPVVVDRDGRSLDGEVVGWAEDPDIAVIRVETAMPTTLSWAPTSELSEGMRIVALGYPAPANAFSVTGGSIVSFERDGEQRPLIRSDSAVDRGNSGGPAITGTGRVAGVATAVDTNPDRLRMVSLIYTADALQEHVDDFIARPSSVTVDCEGATGRPDAPEVVPADGEAWDYGDDLALDALWDGCADGDDQACDDLYWGSPYLSGYEDFAVTCGGRGLSHGTCDGGAGPGDIDPGADPDGSSGADEEVPDPDAAQWDSLAVLCEAGDLAACDDLYYFSPAGSDSELFGSTCGGRSEETDGGCEGEGGGHGGTEQWGYGDDPALDALWDACVAGADTACRDLYVDSPYGSAYEEFAVSCAGRGDWCW